MLFPQNKAFTLAETLITLVVVGVVAALTVPTLLAKYTEQQTVTAVKKFYSEISQAYNSAIAKNGSPDTWEWKYGGAGANHIMSILAPHLRIMNYCGKGISTNKCFGDGVYKTLNPNVNWEVNNPGSYGNYASSRLDNGFIFWTYSASNDSCKNVRGNGNYLQNVCGDIGVDINGYKKPNALGKDTFYFRMTKYGIIPTGTKQETSREISSNCNKNSTNTVNGYACAAWIIEKGNMDYLHREVSW